jgi:transcriptional regulator with XRE-family HTH domain
MKNDLLSLSSRLKYILKNSNVSQTELAKRINVKPQVIQYLCAGQAQKSKFSVEIADALNIDFTWLATGKGAMPEDSEFSQNINFIPFVTFEQIKDWKVLGNAPKINNWVPTNAEFHSDLFAVAISCRAMAPRFDLNTIIILEPIKINALVEPKSFIMVHLKDEDYTIFRQFDVINNTKYLVAINKSLHKDILLQEDDLILGVCKEARWRI